MSVGHGRERGSEAGGSLSSISVFEEINRRFLDVGLDEVVMSAGEAEWRKGIVCGGTKALSSAGEMWPGAWLRFL